MNSVEARLMEYETVDADTGLWRRASAEEHHTAAVSKVVQSLARRLDKVASILFERVVAAIDEEVRFRRLDNGLLYRTLEEAQAEIQFHQQILGAFQERVLQKIRSEMREIETGHTPSVVALETVGDASKLMSDREGTEARLKVPGRNLQSKSLTYVHSRLDNPSVERELKEACSGLRQAKDTLGKVERCWERMVRLGDELEASRLLAEMRGLKLALDELGSGGPFSSVQRAFFHLDDGVKGLILLKEHEEVKVAVDVVQASQKLTDAVTRLLVKAVDNYRKSEESALVDRAFECLNRISEANMEDLNVQALLGVRVLLDVAPLPNASLEKCFRKFGELHANISKKLFEISALWFLQPHFPQGLSYLVDGTVERLLSVRAQLISAHGRQTVREGEGVLPLAEMNIRELELSCRFLENQLLEKPPGQEFFTLSNLLRQVNLQISTAYSALPEKRILENCVAVMSSENFLEFVVSCQQLMFALRIEQRENGEKVIAPEVLQKVGAATGKTTMVKNYWSAIEEILAPLSTFLGNTLHALVREMLINIPESRADLRASLFLAYELTGNALKTLDRELLTNSTVLKVEGEEN